MTIDLEDLTLSNEGLSSDEFITLIVTDSETGVKSSATIPLDDLTSAMMAFEHLRMVNYQRDMRFKASDFEFPDSL